MTQPGTGEGGQGAPESGAQSGAPAGDGGATGTSAQSGATGDGSATGSSTTTSTTAETVSKADFEKVVNQLRAADQNRNKVEQELRQLRDKDLPEADKLKRDFEEVSARVTTLEGDLKKARIENAFLKANKYRWQDPEVALAVADMSAVTIDAEGHVTGLEAALERLAKAKPWMLQQQDNANEGEDKNRPPAGAPPMNGAGGATGSPKGALAERLPALRTRMRPKTN